MLYLVLHILRIVNAVYVETTSGWVRGVTSRRSISFLGIPFAQPPRR